MSTLPVALLAVLAAGCGASALQTHAHAAHISGDTLKAAKHVIEAERNAAQDRVIEQAEYREDAQEQLAEVRSDWQPVVDAYETMRRLHEAYGDRVIAAVARDGEPSDKMVRIAEEMLAAWQALSRAAEPLDIDIPSPPEVLGQIVGGS